MPADNTPPIRKRLAAEAKGIASDPINLAIAREVLRRVREGELPPSSNPLPGQPDNNP